MRTVIPLHARIIVNIGDFDQGQANILYQSRVTGAYHVSQLREGIDTQLDPEDRFGSIETIRKAGMDWYTCCEPIGPEHSAQELVDQLFLGIDLGCFQHAAMRGLPFSIRHYRKKAKLQISGWRKSSRWLRWRPWAVPRKKPSLSMSQTYSDWCPAQILSMPNQELIHAMSRPIRKITAGLNIHNCRKMLMETGFRGILMGMVT